MAENDEITVFRVLLGIGGFGLGVFAVIAALTSPSFEGRIHIFLPAIIFAVIGVVAGTIIDKVATAIRDQMRSRPAPSYPNSPPGGARQAPGSGRPRFCAQCGVALSASARFCGACGHKVGG